MESIKISGMSCQHCVGSVKKTLNDIPGLSNVTVDLDTGEAIYENTGVSDEEIRNAISKIGFDPL